MIYPLIIALLWVAVILTPYKYWRVKWILIIIQALVLIAQWLSMPDLGLMNF